MVEDSEGSLMAKTTEQPTLADLIEQTKLGKPENWEFVDQHVGWLARQTENVSWAVSEGRTSPNQDIRDLAATILDESNEALEIPVCIELERQMNNDPYDIVQMRLAIALWKRGYRSAQVQEQVGKARQHPDLGKVAEKWCK